MEAVPIPGEAYVAAPLLQGETDLCENLVTPKVTSANGKSEQVESWRGHCGLWVRGLPCEGSSSNDIEGLETLGQHLLLCPLLSYRSMYFWVTVPWGQL